MNKKGKAVLHFDTAIIGQILGQLSVILKNHENPERSTIRYGKISLKTLEYLNNYVASGTIQTFVPVINKESKGKDAVNAESSQPGNEKILPGTEKKTARREIIHTKMLKRWKGNDFYSALNDKIKGCRYCQQDKIGFFPNYGMGLVDSIQEGMEQFNKDIMIVADPPINFFIKGALPPAPSACLVSGTDTEGDLANLIGNQQAVKAAQVLQATYPKYVTEAAFLLLSEIKNSGFQLDKILISSLARCFLSIKKYKEIFAHDNKNRLPCFQWLLDELDYLVKKNKPKSILLFSTHFTRFFMQEDREIEDLRGPLALNWLGIPLRITYHPYQWLRNPGLRAKSREDLKSLYDFISGMKNPGPADTI